MMFIWKCWLRFRVLLFRISEGDPQTWHDYDFEQLKAKAARDLDEEDVNVKRLKEPPATLFSKLVVLCVVVNTGFMAASHYGESQTQTNIASYANIIFASIFGIELLVRIIGMGFSGYLFNMSNLFDFGVTIVSLVEILFLSGSSSFSVLRAFRLFRIFKLLKSLQSLRSILRVMAIAFDDAWSMCVVFFLYLFIAALVGMNLFATIIVQTDDDQRANWTSFFNSFIMVFEIITRDAWPDYMRTAIRDVGIHSCLFFLACVFLGDFIILNLFSAVLISSFEDVAEEAEDEDFEKFRQIDTIKRQPLGTMGALVTEQSRRLLRLADHKLKIVDQDGYMNGTASQIGEEVGLLDEGNAAEAQQRLASLGVEGTLCHLCGEVKRQPFPPPSKLIAPLTVDELHSRMCARIALRKAKARVIRDLLEEIGGVGALDTEELTMTANNIGLSVHQQLQSFKFGGDLDAGFHGLGSDVGLPGLSLKGAKPSPETVDELFGRAWEAGLLLNRNADDYFFIKSWEPIAALLKEEQLVLNLHVGEEQIGQSLVAYTRANVPREFFTNGGKSLWLFGPRNRFRVILTQVVANPWFDRFILLMIAVSSILMAIDNPRTPTWPWLSATSRALTVLFAVEALCKIISFGFIFHPTAYVKDGWNLLDGAIVAISLISWILESYISGNQLSAVKVLRVLRVLRPLRVINRNRGLRMVVSTLVLSIKGIANVALINGLIYLIFSILGVQLFAGSLYSCTDEAIHTKGACIGTYQVVEQREFYHNVTIEIGGVNITSNVSYVDDVNVTVPREWKNAPYHFDDTYHAFINLFHIVTLDAWGETMWATVDGVGPDVGPIKNNRLPWALYFIAFITICCFFLLNMFVGVIISSFGAVKDKMDGSSMLTSDQKLWVETQRMMLNFRPERKRKPVFPNFPPCMMLYNLAESPKFEALTGAAVALNVVFMGMVHQGQTETFSDMLKIANYIFLGCFIFEALVKLGAYGIQYFKSTWNCFDFLLVIIGIVDVVADGNIPINVGILRVFRVFRIMRMLVLVRRAKNVRILLETLWYSLPSLANIGTFLLLVFFMYAILGNQLFANVKHNAGITDNINFETFQNSFLYLLQLVTLDNWGVVMLGASLTENCGKSTNDQGVDDCGTAYAPLYFISFVIIASWVIMNLFIAIILDNFNNTMTLDKSKLKMSHLKKFTDSWSEFDPEATLMMETRYFPNLLLALHSPLGIDRVTDRRRIMQLADEYRIVEHGGVIHFVETMIPMARRVLAVDFTDAELRAHEEHWRVQFPSLAKLKILRYRMRRVTVDQYFGATYLSAAYRRRTSYRYVNMLRDEKLSAIERWYEEHNVPVEQRTATLRMLERAEARRLTDAHFSLRKAIPDDSSSQIEQGSRPADSNNASVRSRPTSAGLGTGTQRTSMRQIRKSSGDVQAVGELMGIGRRKEGK